MTPKARVAITFADGSAIDAWDKAELHDDFVDPLGKLTFEAYPPRRLFDDYRLRLGKGDAVEVFVNEATQGRWLIQDAERSYSPEGGLGVRVTCHTPLVTPYEGGVDPDGSFSTSADTPVAALILQVLRPYGFTAVSADAVGHVAALSGKGTSGTKPIALRLGDLKYKKATVHAGETAYQFITGILTRLGYVLRYRYDGSLLVCAPNFDQPTCATVGLSTHPGSLNGADLFIGGVHVKETNAGQYSQTSVLGQRSLDVDASSVARPKAATLAESVLPRRCSYFSTAAAYKPIWFKDKAARDPQQAASSAALVLGAHAKDAYVVDGGVNGWVSTTGRVWTVDTMVRVVVEPEGLDEAMYLLARTLHLDSGGGQKTSLKFIPKGALILGQKPGSA